MSFRIPFLLSLSPPPTMAVARVILDPCNKQRQREFPLLVLLSKCSIPPTWVAVTAHRSLIVYVAPTQSCHRSLPTNHLTTAPSLVTQDADQGEFPQQVFLLYLVSRMSLSGAKEEEALEASFWGGCYTKSQTALSSV